MATNRSFRAPGRRRRGTSAKPDVDGELCSCNRSIGYCSGKQGSPICVLRKVSSGEGIMLGLAQSGNQVLSEKTVAPAAAAIDGIPYRSGRAGLALRSGNRERGRGCASTPIARCINDYAVKSCSGGRNRRIIHGVCAGDIRPGAAGGACFLPLVGDRSNAAGNISAQLDGFSIAHGLA
ncbi:MAG: hypothetical protein KIPDCIKN_04159 [Haliscomenobacter sp.]|jgi:hypothetical protein|nr:hypothetical protein [Haliscomenobacter sp.]